jgi:hypothetical protein
VGAGLAQFKSDENVQHLLSSATVASNVGGSVADSDNDTAKVTKKIGNLSVGLQSLKIVNGNKYLLTMTLANLSTNKSIWVALSNDGLGNLKGSVRDSNGLEYISSGNDVSGIELGSFQFGVVSQVKEIKVGDSASVTMKFSSRDGSAASSGQCAVQMEFLVGDDFINGQSHCKAQNFVAKIGTD